MIDLLKEDRVPVRDALRAIGIEKDDVGVCRWCNEPGVRGVVLESVLQGGRRFTSVSAVLRFLAKLNRPRKSVKTSTPRRRQREIERNERALDLAGIA